jgi:hypothetical protein
MSHGDNSAKQYFTSALTEERKELETCLTADGANSSLVIARERESTADKWALETLVKALMQICTCLYKECET